MVCWVASCRFRRWRIVHRKRWRTARCSNSGPGSCGTSIHPHVPHGWDARVMFEETTGTLLCGDLFTHLGNGPAVTEDDIVGPAMEAEALFRSTSLAPDTTSVMRTLGDLEPATLALMHGSTFRGDGKKALYDLADAYDVHYLH